MANGDDEQEVEVVKGGRKRKYSYALSFKNQSIVVEEKEGDQTFTFVLPQTGPQLDFYLRTQGYIKVVSARLAGKSEVNGQAFVDELNALAAIPEEEVAKKFAENKTPKEKGWLCIFSEYELLAFATLLYRHGHIKDQVQVTAETALHILRSENLTREMQEKIKRNREFLNILLEILPQEETEVGGLF